MGEVQLSSRLIEGHEFIIRKGGRPNDSCDVVSKTGCAFSGGDGYGLLDLSLPNRPMMMV